MSYDLLIRQRDGKCRAIDKEGKPLTGWCNNSLNVVDAMRRKEACKKK